jgi:MFS family permease
MYNLVGAAIYIAESSPQDQRGFYTSFMQMMGSGGSLLSIIIIIITKYCLNNEKLSSWGWRIPFLFSGLLLIISFCIRLSISETNLFLNSRKNVKINPITMSFKSINFHYMLLALCGCTMGMGVISYTCLTSLTFLQLNAHVPLLTSYYIFSTSLLFSLPFFTLSGYLSDIFGRKPLV